MSRNGLRRQQGYFVAGVKPSSCHRNDLEISKIAEAESKQILL